jgi:hypothetical protein
MFGRAKSLIREKRGLFKQLFIFYRSPTVPTVRMTTDRGIVCLELGKRARKRENSIVDSMDKHGWGIESEPILIKSGKETELGYMTHPAGCTVTIKPNVQITFADENGNPVADKYIEASFCGTIGRGAEIDDFNQSIEREKEGNWMLPLIIGIIAGVVLFAPFFTFIMSLAAGAGK